MDRYTIHLAHEKSSFLQNCIQSGMYIDASEVFDEALNALHEKDSNTLLARNIFQKKVNIGTAQAQKGEFSHRDIASIIEGSHLCPVDQKEKLPYALTNHADNEIEALFKSKGDFSNVAQALKKLENTIKGLNKLEHPNPLSKLITDNEQLKTKNLYYLKTRDYYLVFEYCDTGINIITLYTTEIDLGNLKNARKNNIFHVK